MCDLSFALFVALVFFLFLFHSFCLSLTFCQSFTSLDREALCNFLFQSACNVSNYSDNDLLTLKLLQPAPLSRVFALLYLLQSLSQEEIAHCGQLFSHLSAAL